MSAPSSPSPHEQEATEEPKGGPANPHDPERADGTGLDAPTPPGGPQRQDAAGTGEVPDGRDRERRVDQDSPSGVSGSSTIPIEEEEPHPERGDGSGPTDLQEENAATSLDEPSEDLT